MSNKEFSNSITLTRVADGKSASSLIIETEYDEILKFEEFDSLDFSPRYYSFRLLNLSTNNYIQNFSWEFGYLNNAREYVSIATSNDTEGPFFNCFANTIVTEDNVMIDNSSSYTTKYLNIDALYLKTKEDENYSFLRSQIEEGKAIFKIIHTEAGLTAIKYICVKNGVSENMAKLHIGSSSIAAAIRDSSLEFSANGLRLDGGDLVITKKVYTKVDNLNSENFEPDIYYKLDSNSNYVKATGQFEEGVIYYAASSEDVLYADNKTGDLVVHGSVYANDGVFHGDVYANNGTFNGEISATGGKIGGFTITSDSEGSPRLVSPDGGIILDGGNNQIIANSIELGAYAKLTGQLIFGAQEQITCALCNPDLNDGKILYAKNFSLTNDGTLKLGKIEMYGGSSNSLDGYIRSNYIDSDGQNNVGFWQINENGSAEFRSIRVNDAHIENAVLEIETIQSVGSTMIFKEASKIVEVIENYSFETDKGLSTVLYAYKLDQLINVHPEDYILIGNQVYKVRFSKMSEQYSIFSLYGEEEEQPSLLSVGQIVCFLGTEASANNCIISIHGGESKTEANIGNFAVPQALSFSSFKNKEDEGPPQLTYTKHLILGKLSNSGVTELEGVNGYGLYADNVFLKGSLTTQISEGGYAGINTLGKVFYNNSPIIFWGGANSKDDVGSAKFKVNANGDLYAQNANIEDSTIVGGLLRAAKIETASIYGNNAEENQASLAIYNANKGIAFKTLDDENKEVEVFTIGNSGINQNGTSVLDISGGLPIFHGKLSAASKEYISIYDSNGITFKKEEQQIAQILPYYTILNIENEQVISNEGIKFFAGTQDTLALEVGKVTVLVNSYFNNDTFLGAKSDGTYVLEQRKVDNGYDIYIY